MPNYISFDVNCMPGTGLRMAASRCCASNPHVLGGASLKRTQVPPPESSNFHPKHNKCARYALRSQESLYGRLKPGEAPYVDVPNTFRQPHAAASVAAASLVALASMVSWVAPQPAAAALGAACQAQRQQPLPPGSERSAIPTGRPYVQAAGAAFSPRLQAPGYLEAPALCAASTAPGEPLDSAAAGVPLSQLMRAPHVGALLGSTPQASCGSNLSSTATRSVSWSGHAGSSIDAPPGASVSAVGRGVAAAAAAGLADAPLAAGDVSDATTAPAGKKRPASKLPSYAQSQSMKHYSRDLFTEDAWDGMLRCAMQHLCSHLASCL